jgi:membrane protein DedA with SNARE-associated domain
MYLVALLTSLGTLPELVPASRVQDWIAAGGPGVIFILLFACGLGLPLPEDIPLLASGFFAAHGEMNLVAVSILAWLGIVGGDCMLYRFGRKYGLNITKVPFIGKHVTHDRILKAERLFDRYGVGVVAVGRMMAGVRGAMVVAAGAIRFNFVKFVIVDGLAALVSGGIFVGLGYWLGSKFRDKTFDEVVRMVEHRAGWVVAALSLVVVGFLAYLWWKHRRQKAATDVALAAAVAVVEKKAAPVPPIRAVVE